MAVEQTDDKWTLLIGEKGNKYKSIAYYEVPEENELYLMFPFKLKDDLREFAFKKNIYAKYDNSQKAWKYSLDDKLEILEEVKRLFYGHPEMQDYLDEPESTPEPTKVNLNSVSVPTKPEIQTSPPQEQPKPVKSFKERVEERNNNNNKNKNNNTAVKIPKPKNEPMSVIDIKAEDFDNSITEKSAPETAIQVHRGAGLKLRVSVDEIVDRWKEFRRLDHELLDDTDYQEVWTPTGPKKFKKKSAFRKYGTAYEISCKIIGDPMIVYRDDKYKSFIFKVYMIAFPSNNPAHYQDGWGVCDSLERCIYEEKKFKDKKTGKWEVKEKCPPDCDWRRHFNHFQHDIEATAHTRSKNRAISDLVAGGEVSYEEMDK